jgi:hypothetical protein
MKQWITICCLVCMTAVDVPAGETKSNKTTEKPAKKNSTLDQLSAVSKRYKQKKTARLDDRYLLTILTVDLWDKAVPVLAKELATASRGDKHAFELLLAHVGGEKVVKILENAGRKSYLEYAKLKDPKPWAPIPKLLAKRFVSSDGVHAQILSIACRFGLPRSTKKLPIMSMEFSQFKDKRSGLHVYRLEKTKLRRRQYLGFSIHVSEDKRHAICKGSFSSQGFDMITWVLVLEKGPKGWQVIRTRLLVMA